MKKIVYVLFAICIAFSFLSCQKENKNDVPKSTKIITDMLGRTVEIPVKVERIVPHGNAPRLLTYLGLADKFVGIPECEHAKSPIMAYAYVNKDLWKDLHHVGTDALGAGVWYPEEIISCNPDLIVCSYTKDVADDMQNKTGIPVFSVGYQSLFSKEYNQSLKLLAEACGVKEKGDAIVDYIENCLEDLKTRSAGISKNEKPSVLAAAATFKGGHSINGVYANYQVFEVIDANDVAIGVFDTARGVVIDKEKIISWNPDKIFFDASNIKLVKMDYEKDPEYFAQLKAVKAGELYQWPNSTWHYSNVEIPLVTSYFVGKLLYPDRFKDIDFEEKAGEIFEMFLGDKNYLKVLDDAGVGYKKIKLGE